MTRTSLTLLLFAIAPFAFADQNQNAVMKTVFTAAAHANHVHGVAPAVVREKTLGGADGFATRFAGKDVAAAYARVNADQANVTDYFPKLVKTMNVNEPVDWTKVDGTFPAANSVMVFSRPVFDGGLALVRADVIPRKGTATTTFYELEHQRDDSWKIVKAVTATYDGARR